MNKLFIGESLDGYIATLDDSLTWLESVSGDTGYDAFLSDIDTVVMGKRTFEWLNALDTSVLPEWPYQDKQTLVLTHEPFPQGRFVHENIKVFDDIDLLNKRESQTWLVGGGELIRECLKQGVIDELFISIAPVLLGDGIPLFPKGQYQQDFILESVQQSGQFVQMHYIKSE